MEESRNVSDKYLVSISFTFITEILRGPGLDSLSRDFNKKNLLCTSNVRQLILGRNCVIGQPIADIMKEYMFMYLFDKTLEDIKKKLIDSVCLIGC